MDASTRLVRELAAALSRGDDAARATRALGLLLERERVSRPAGDDEDIVRILGPELAAQRLGPVAIREAVDLLLAHLSTVEVPAPGVIWALTKSFDPRIVPHLAALLERIVDDPGHADVAAQLVVGLTCFFDPRSLAAVRIAAQRGHGDARESAARWLALHGGRSVSHSPAQRHLPSRTFDLEVDAYHLQGRAGTSTFLVNDGQDAVVVVDAASGRMLTRARFSPGFAPDRPIRTWCLSADGREAAVFPDGGQGSLVSLTGAPALDLAAPPGALESLRYWWDEALLVSLGEVTTLWALSRHDGVAAFEPRRSLDVRRSHPGWMKQLDRLPPLRSRVLRTEPLQHRLLAYDHSTPPGDLVVVGSAGDIEVRTPAPRFVPEVAYHAGCFYLLYDHEVQAVNVEGTLVDIFPAPDGVFLRALDIVLGPDPMLVVAASRFTTSRSSLVLSYALGPPAAH